MAFDRAFSSEYNEPILSKEVIVPDSTGSSRERGITEDIFNHLVELAAFELDDEQATYLRQELNSQLKAIRELEAIEIDEDIPITSHGVPYTPEISLPLRDDTIDPCKEAGEIVNQAPEIEDRYIIVPDIPHEELE